MQCGGQHYVHLLFPPVLSLVWQHSFWESRYPKPSLLLMLLRNCHCCLSTGGGYLTLVHYHHSLWVRLTLKGIRRIINEREDKEGKVFEDKIKSTERQTGNQNQIEGGRWENWYWNRRRMEAWCCCPVWESSDEVEKALKSVSHDWCQTDEISRKDVPSEPLTAGRLLDVSYALH